MEYTLGLRLLDRARHGMEPTTYGRALISRGATVFDELRQAVEELKFLADPTAGELRVGSSEAMAAGFLPAVIDRLSRQYPRVTSNVVQAVFTAMQYRELRERSIDLLLGRVFTPFREEDLAVEILFDDQVAVVVGAQSPWVRSRRLKLADLLDEPWILPPADSVPGSLAVEIFRASGLQVPENVGDGTLRRDASPVDLAFQRQGFVAQGIADQIASSASPNWHCDVKESDLESSDRALHQLRPRRCKAIGKGQFAVSSEDRQRRCAS
jgi:DNA-binding transcriptional LysR family regulator